MAVAGALTLLHVLLVGWAVRRLSPVHPLVLWTAPFAFATALFALGALPYKQMTLTTGLLVAGATAAFWAGGALSHRLSWPGARRKPPQPLAAGVDYVSAAAAAALSLTLMALGLGAFLGELVAEYGLRNALITSGEVRLDIQEGAAEMTIKYVYLVFAAAALTALASALAPTARARWTWWVATLLVAAAGYPSTGRSNVVLPLIIAAIAYGTARGLRPDVRRALASAAAAVCLVLAIFIAGGTIIGKTLENNPLGRISSVFTEHRVLEPFALPYQYATAPLAALDVQRRISANRESMDGCATFSVACQVGQAAGLPMEPVTRIRPFTGEPMPWNTYTALDLPLMDGGHAGVVMFFGLFGALMGALWRMVRAGSGVTQPAYAVLGSTLVYAPVQNNMFAPHILGALAAACLMLIAGRWLASRTWLSGTRLASG